jgi:hypothetical protein
MMLVLMLMRMEVEVVRRGGLCSSLTLIGCCEGGGGGGGGDGGGGNGGGGDCVSPLSGVMSSEAETYCKTGRRSPAVLGRWGGGGSVEDDDENAGRG